VIDGFHVVAIEITQVHGVIPGVVLGPLARCVEHLRTGRYSGPVNRIHGVTVGGAEGKMQLPGLRPASLMQPEAGSAIGPGQANNERAAVGKRITSRIPIGAKACK
jgi:hypothetical protein